MTLCEFGSILLGAEITIHTDHINIWSIGDSSYGDEYGPMLKYIEGPKNIVAEYFSCMLQWDTLTSPSVGKKSATPADNQEITSNSDPLDNYHTWIDDIKDILDCVSCLPEEECYLNLPADLQENNPLDMETVVHKSQKIRRMDKWSLSNYTSTHKWNYHHCENENMSEQINIWQVIPYKN